MDDIEKRGSPRVVLRSVRNYVRRAVPAFGFVCCVCSIIRRTVGSTAVEEFSKAQAEIDRLNRSFGPCHTARRANALTNPA